LWNVRQVLLYLPANRKLNLMFLARALESDYASIVDLANLAFRGAGPSAGWNSEADYIEGTRLTESLLREDMAAKPDGVLLTYREDPKGELFGTVSLEPKKDGVWYLGLLTIRPDLQNRQMGRALLAVAEDFAKQNGACRIRMSVVNVRTTLIAWYERRGYRLTGETQPFPYGDQRFGRPLRDDLHFVLLEKDVGSDHDDSPATSLPD
jgi:ribosomal protein S18 acetylase RimI-like enzyme